MKSKAETDTCICSNLACPINYSLVFLKTVLLIELINTASSTYSLLLSCEEGMALGTYFHVYLLLC